MPAIAVENLCFHYDSRKPVLDNLSFTIETGSVTSILGPNGSGKTTLLKLMLGLKQPVSGSIMIAGRPLDQIPLSERAKLLAYVPQ
ncbi:MAG TPA: ATP-binding cassette domain-containing protein, partial [Candidatus Rifleibacterium sp.]|nr:ATP-binding cassette domain-containing protein [Candidatus Rifleibacterium sp.]